MNTRLPPKLIITVIAILSAFCFAGPLLAEELEKDSAAEENLNQQQEQARKYRQAGLEYQQGGNLAEAMSFYQKAIVLDPSYAVAYNDLGVIYEAMGFPERAKESYFKSIKINPEYLSAYTNVALFYEGQRDLERAVFYWGKRAELGSLDDPWTQKAASRFKDIRSVLSSRPLADAREEDVLGLIKDVSVYKTVFDKADRTQARNHLNKAKQYYNKKKLTGALKEAFQAQDLDQSNPEITGFIERIDFDPAGAAAYNDLGAVYEAANILDRAEKSYLKALKLDPQLLSAYVNLALFYEKQRDLEKAEVYWTKRAELGTSDNPWKEKAARRVKDLRMVLSSNPLAAGREDDVLGLMKDVAASKTAVNKNDKTLAAERFEKAKQSFDRGDIATAIKEAIDAQYLDQDNPEIETFIEKAERRALSR